MKKLSGHGAAHCDKHHFHGITKWHFHYHTLLYLDSCLPLDFWATDHKSTQSGSWMLKLEMCMCIIPCAIATHALGPPLLFNTFALGVIVKANWEIHETEEPGLASVFWVSISFYQHSTPPYLAFQVIQAAKHPQHLFLDFHCQTTPSLWSWQFMRVQNLIDFCILCSYTFLL